jgi:hypothetical protein
LIFHDKNLKENLNEKTATSKLQTPEIYTYVSSKDSKTNVTEQVPENRFQMQLARNCQISNLNLADFLNSILQYSELNVTSLTSTASYSSQLSSAFVLNPNLEIYFCNTIGSSYYNGSSSNYTLLLTNSELKELCQLIKKLFVKCLINQINKYLNEFLTQQHVIY